MLFSNTLHGLMQQNSPQLVPMYIFIILISKAVVMFLSMVLAVAVLVMLKSSPIRKSYSNDLGLFYTFSFGATKSSFAMLGMSAGINSSPTPWETEMTAVVGEQLSTFVKTGIPSGNVPKFNADGEYIKGKDHSGFFVVRTLHFRSQCGNHVS